MDRRDEYLLRAAELNELAAHSHFLKIHFESLALAYLRLADQAKHNDDLDLACETPPPMDDPTVSR